MHSSSLAGFSAALKSIKTDSRGRANIGTVVSDAKGRTYGAAVDNLGRILLTPLQPAERSPHEITQPLDRAVEVPRG